MSTVRRKRSRREIRHREKFMQCMAKLVLLFGPPSSAMQGLTVAINDQQRIKFRAAVTSFSWGEVDQPNWWTYPAAYSEFKKMALADQRRDQYTNATTKVVIHVEQASAGGPAAATRQ